MYNFSAIWVRIISFFILIVVFIAVIFFLEKKLAVKPKIIISSLLIVISVVLMLPTINALVEPKIVAIEGSFCDEFKTSGVNPFEIRYSFECDEKIVSVDLDPLSKRIIYKDDFAKGEIYTIVYEKTTNLIVYVSKVS